MRKTDVLVVGAGPAGSVCAYLLQQAGVECLLIDRAVFPREKICGGGLTAKAWRLLDSLMPGVEYDYHPVKHVRVQWEDDRCCEFDAAQELRMTNRKDFDYALLNYYRQVGGEFMNDTFERFEETDDERIQVTLRSGLRVECRWLVAADGVHSRIRRQMLGREEEANALFLEQYSLVTEPDEVFVHFSPSYGYGCFYKFSSFRRDVYGYRADTTDRGGFAQALARFSVPQTRIIGAFIPGRTARSNVGRVILIGDAGGFPNRLTGEGLYDAFLTARNASRAILRGEPFEVVNRKVFRKMRRQELTLRFYFSPFGLRVLRWGLRFPRFVKWCFDVKMSRASVFPARPFDDLQP